MPQNVEYNINARKGTMEMMTTAVLTKPLLALLGIWWYRPNNALAKGKMIYLSDQFLEVVYDAKCPIVITDGSTNGTIGNHCNSRGRLTRDTFLPHLQRTTIKFRMSTGKFLSDSAQVLSCPLEEPGCVTTSLDTYAYIWDKPDYCVLSLLRTEKVNMMKQGTKYCIISWPDLNTKIVFQIRNNPQKHCGKPTDLYPTNYSSLFVAIIGGGFDSYLEGNLIRKGMMPPNFYGI